MQKDPRRLPPLDLLLTFEAAARQASFTRAAAERFLTQSAVSRQVKALEEDLGVALFRRHHRALSLTDEGRALHETARQALEQLRGTVARLRAPHAREVLTVTTTPGLASLWLIPRLGGFTADHPGIDVRIDASFAKRDLEGEGIDIAVRYDRVGDAQGVKLFDEEVMPVCSPSLLRAGAPPLRTPQDLRRHTLLRIDNPAGVDTMQEWAPWLTAMGQPDLQPASILTLSHYDAVISAAVLGQGVALGRRPLIDALLREARLVAPLKGSLSSPRAYYVRLSERGRRSPSALALEQWLLAQAHAG
jgi:DNA-binding transcriptional LysR family regulator